MCVQKQRASLYYLDIISCHSAPQHLVPSGLRVCKTRTGTRTTWLFASHTTQECSSRTGHLQSDSRSSRATHELVTLAGVAPAFKKIDNVCPITKSPAKKKTARPTLKMQQHSRARGAVHSDYFRCGASPCVPLARSPATTCIRAGSGGIAVVLARAPRRSPVHNLYGWHDLTTPRGSPSMLGLTRGALLDVRRLCS